MRPFVSIRVWVLILLGLHTGGCASLFGYDIHAPGILSRNFMEDIPRSPVRMGLYVPEGMKDFLSTDKGTRFSDPQTYHIGEAYVPMLIEAFQHGFEEFVLIETEPTPSIMKNYGITHLSVVEIEGFKNRKDIRGQGLDLYTQTTVFGQDLKLITRFETRGASEARRVFAIKGGPEVNLNAAIESNLRSIIRYLQETLRTAQVNT